MLPLHRILKKGTYKVSLFSGGENDQGVAWLTRLGPPVMPPELGIGDILCPLHPASVTGAYGKPSRRAWDQLTAFSAESNASILSGTSLFPTLLVATAPAMVSML